MSAYLDRELPSGEAKEVEEHLRSCSACRSQFWEFSRLEGFRSLLVPEQVTEDQWRDCWQGIKEKTTGVAAGSYARRRLRRVAFYTTVAAAACVLLVVGGYFLTVGSAPAPEVKGASVVINDYDDARYTLLVEDNPDFVIIKLTPVTESPGGG